MWLARKVTAYSNATILKRKWFHTIISVALYHTKVDKPHTV